MYIRVFQASSGIPDNLAFGVCGVVEYFEPG